MLVDQLRRRALIPTDVDAADRLVGEALAPVRESPSLVRLDWEGPQPRLSVRRVAPGGSDWGSPLADGIWAPDEKAESLGGARSDAAGAEPAAASEETGPLLEVTLPVTRPAEVDIDLEPDPRPPATASGYAGSVLTLVASRLEDGATLAEAAAVAGATAAETAAEDWAASHEGRRPATAAEVAEAFVAFHNAAGSDFYLVSSSDRRAVLGNRRCPFGEGIAERHLLCRTTSALLGSLAARANGRAVVSLDEAIAHGDNRCRAVVDFDAEASRWNHYYSWPPAGRASQPGDHTAGGFRVSLSLRLPRDRLSVPLIRHLAASALSEVGAVPDEVHDVELAVAEAASNVIKHSERGDAYDVVVTIGPELVELRVIDVGRGFDSEAMEQMSPGPEDESGRGVALMHALVDQARFVSAPERGTIVHLIKRLHFDDEAPARKLMLASLSSSRSSSRREE
jgi:anti-sigma regulatory factor (Ser/Thr protein kinase)